MEVGQEDTRLKSALEDLRRAMRSGDSKARRSALWSLGELGGSARSAVPEILRAIDEESAGLYAALALQRIDPEGAESAFVQILRNLAASAGARAGAAGALRQIETNSREAVEALAEALAYPEEEVARAVSNALSFLSRTCPSALPKIIEQLNHPAPAARRNAARVLWHIIWPIDPPSELQAVASALARALKDPNPSVRLEVIKGLQHLPGPTTGVAAELASLMGDPDPAIRTEALRALRYQHPDDSDVVHALAAGLQDQDPLVRVEAALGFAYKSHGREGDETLRAVLLEALDADDPKARRAALNGLWRPGWREESMVAVFVRCLKDPDPQVRATVVSQFSNIGLNEPEMAKAAVPALLEALNDPSEGVRLLAAKALVIVGPGESALHTFLRGRIENEHDKLEAGSMLLEIGVDVDTALRALLEVLKKRGLTLSERQKSLRRWGAVVCTEQGKAAQAILQHAPPREDAARELRGLIHKEEDPVLRVAVALALLRTAPGDEDAMAVITEGASHPEEFVRHTTVFGLRHILNTDKRVLPMLFKAVEDPSKTVRAGALSSLEPLSKTLRCGAVRDSRDR